MSAFVRSAVPVGDSHAIRRFRTAQREINEFYWSSRLSTDVLLKLASGNGGYGANMLLDHLSINSEARSKVGTTADDLRRRVKTSDRWVRAATLLIATSAFERYIAEISGLAVESDPLLAGT